MNRQSHHLGDTYSYMNGRNPSFRARGGEGGPLLTSDLGGGDGGGGVLGEGAGSSRPLVPWENGRAPF